MRSEELFEGRSSQLHTELMKLRKRKPEKKIQAITGLIFAFIACNL